MGSIFLVIAYLYITTFFPIILLFFCFYFYILVYLLVILVYLMCSYYPFPTYLLFRRWIIFINLILDLSRRIRSAITSIDLFPAFNGYDVAIININYGYLIPKNYYFIDFLQFYKYTHFFNLYVLLVLPQQSYEYIPN